MSARLELQGQLITHVYQNNQIKAELRHELNSERLSSSDVPRLAGSNLEALEVYAWRLKDSVAGSVPETYVSRKFKQQNAGIMFLAYFPVEDFRDLLGENEQKKRSQQKKYIKAKIAYWAKKIKSTLNGRDTISIQFGQGGISFSAIEDPFLQARSEYESAKAEVDDLREELKLTKKAGVTHILLQRGFDIAKVAGDDNSTTDVVVIGNRQATEKLMDSMGTDIATVTQVLVDLFSPQNEQVNYRSTGRDATYKSEPYIDGTYNPFGKAKEVKVFDYRKQK